MPIGCAYYSRNRGEEQRTENGHPAGSTENQNVKRKGSRLHPLTRSGYCGAWLNVYLLDFASQSKTQTTSKRSSGHCCGAVVVSPRILFATFGISPCSQAMRTTPAHCLTSSTRIFRSPFGRS